MTNERKVYCGLEIHPVGLVIKRDKGYAVRTYSICRCLYPIFQLQTTRIMKGTRIVEVNVLTGVQVNYFVQKLYGD